MKQTCLIFSLFAGIACFLADMNQLTWLAIVGIILTIVAIVINVFDTHGVGTILAVFFIAFFHFGKNFIISKYSGKGIVDWVYSTNSGIFFIARIMLVGCLALLLSSILIRSDQN